MPSTPNSQRHALLQSGSAPRSATRIQRTGHEAGGKGTNASTTSKPRSQLQGCCICQHTKARFSRCRLVLLNAFSPQPSRPFCRRAFTSTASKRKPSGAVLIISRSISPWRHRHRSAQQCQPLPTKSCRACCSAHRPGFSCTSMTTTPAQGLNSTFPSVRAQSGRQRDQSRFLGSEEP